MIDERNPDPRGLPPRRGITPTQIALIVAALLIVAFALWTFASTRRANPDVLTDANSVAVLMRHIAGVEDAVDSARPIRRIQPADARHTEGRRLSAVR